MRELADDIPASLVEATDIAGDACDYAMDQGKWLVLAERDEMDLVVDENALALGVKEQSTVVWEKTAMRSEVRGVDGRLPFDGAGEEWMAEADRQCRGYLCELSILK